MGKPERPVQRNRLTSGANRDSRRSSDLSRSRNEGPNSTAEAEAADNNRPGTGRAGTGPAQERDADRNPPAKLW